MDEMETFILLKHGDYYNNPSIFKTLPESVIKKISSQYNGKMNELLLSLWVDSVIRMEPSRYKIILAPIIDKALRDYYNEQYK